ncbi:hypothetical protein Y032_0198g1601 [Ancylostoma ceylanicum]|uniref:Uncharacterized protein n=1 Tax=Ancylostoma ceylanicum TaxID=53326 RepID=A0A016SN09_9BILA|nr:hypothetical protein Y032_0198g1601 [Ancylostoma ceylanicum]
MYLTGAFGRENIAGKYPFPLVFIRSAIQYNSSIYVLISWRKCGASARVNKKCLNLDASLFRKMFMPMLTMGKFESEDGNTVTPGSLNDACGP